MSVQFKHKPDKSVCDQCCRNTLGIPFDKLLGAVFSQGIVPRGLSYRNRYFYCERVDGLAPENMFIRYRVNYLASLENRDNLVVDNMFYKLPSISCGGRKYKIYYLKQEHQYSLF